MLSKYFIDFVQELVVLLFQFVTYFHFDVCVQTCLSELLEDAKNEHSRFLSETTKCSGNYKNLNELHKARYMFVAF